MLWRVGIFWTALTFAFAACSPGTIQQSLDAGEDDGESGHDAGDHGYDAGDPGSDPTGDDAAQDGGQQDADANGGDPATGYTCQNPHPSWRLCEDFEAGGGNFDTWLAGSDFIGGVGQDDRGRIALASDQVHGGSWAVTMPADPGSGYQGASLDWRDCDGAQETNCSMHSHEALYFRAWIRFAPDHRYVHHFLNIGGSQPDDYWYHGTAGCLPNGETSMGTTVDFEENTHASHFYTYWPEMSCDTRCDRYMDVDQVCQDCADKGFPTCDQQPQCCWGNHFSPEPEVRLPVGEWFCFEMMMQANTVGERDGVMAYWINDALALRVDESSPTPIWWRTSPTLALNRVRLQHYIETEDAGGFSNRVWFDDIVVSTERIGCD